MRLQGEREFDIWDIFLLLENAIGRSGYIQKLAMSHNLKFCQIKFHVWMNHKKKFQNS